MENAIDVLSMDAKLVKKMELVLFFVRNLDLFH